MTPVSQGSSRTNSRQKQAHFKQLGFTGGDHTKTLAYNPNILTS